MTFDLTRDQLDFSASLRDFFTEQYGADRLRAVVDDGLGHDKAFWRALVDELDLPGLTVDEAHGGSGAGTVELVLLLEQYGRTLVTSPLLATAALALPAMTHAATPEAQATWLPQIAAGATTATWAALGPAGTADLDGAAVRATSSGGGWVLQGSRSWVLDGTTADVVLTVANTSDGPGLFLVEADAPGLRRTPLASVDPTLQLADVTLEATPAHLISGTGTAPGLERALAVAQIAFTGLQLGCLSATLDMAVAHAGSRVQFGRPIGGFQAVKHRCADVFMDTETTRWVVLHAAARAADPDTSTAELVGEAHLASAYAGAASARATANLLQILGGIGYTWEHEGHLLFKRSAALGRLLGPIGAHLDAVGDEIASLPSAAPA